MILKSLRLRGFKGLRAGIGLEEIFIDFTKLPAGLIAVTGANGMGKTTILDNMQPFRLMPYKCRKSKDFSTGAFSFYDQCYGADALKELVWTMGDKDFKEVIAIDADRKKQEAYLYEFTQGKWKPLNDGKTRTFDEAIEKIMGSPSLFFTGPFRSQGAKNLSDYSRGDIMGIISELLNIDNIAAQGTKAREVIKALTAAMSPLNFQRETLQSEIQQEETIKNQLWDTEIQRQAATGAIEVTQQHIVEKQDAITDAQKKQASVDSEKRRLADLEGIQSQDATELSAIEREQATAQMKHDADKAAIIRQTGADTAELEKERCVLADEQQRKQTAYEAAKQEISGKLERAKKIASGGEMIRGKVKEEAEKTAALETFNAELVTLESKESEARWQSEVIQKMKTERGDLARDVDRLMMSYQQSNRDAKTRYEEAKRQADKLTGLPCEEAGFKNDSCRFVKDAVEAKAALPSLEKALEIPVPEELATKQQELSALDEKLSKVEDTFPQAAAAVKTCREQIDATRKELDEIARYTKLIPELEQAEANIRQFEADLAGKEQEYSLAVAGIEEKTAALNEKISRLTARRDEAIAELAKNLRVSVEGLQQKAAAIKDRMTMRGLDILTVKESLSTDYAAVIIGLQAEVAELEQKLTALDKDVREIEAEAKVHQSKLASIAEKKKEVTAIQEKIGRFNREISYWVLLSKACSNDGIIALEIDDAGPGISSTTNDILLSCYGPRYAIRLETQGLKADGSAKEAFSIIVLDSETGEEAPLDEKSGGQLGWLEDAITRGICIHNTNRSDRIFKTTFSDEKDVALDPEKKDAFFDVKRKALELGTHEREFFISHTPDYIERADARIVLAKGSVTIQ